jgi:hypothetical protein
LSHRVFHDGIDHGNREGPHHGDHHGQRLGAAFEFVVIGDTVAACPSGSVYPASADVHAEELLRWVRQQKFPWPRFGRPLWVSARDLENLLYPEYLAAVGWEPQPWQTVARHLRKQTRWRQRDRRRGTDRRGSSPTEYMIRGAKKPRRGS